MSDTVGKKLGSPSAFSVAVAGRTSGVGGTPPPRAGGSHRELANAIKFSGRGREDGGYGSRDGM